ncbi:MAG: RNA polymerase factor sigma-54 [Acidobacteria bacterium]|nr:RNA polymerase factor sigma-54 [Acidobacteriota bacterium]
MVNKNPLLRQNLQVGLVQKLALTPALLQKIELLKLSHLELSDFVKNELMQNPVLEEDPSTRGSESAAATEISLEEAAGKSDATQDRSFEDIDYQAFFGEYLDSGQRGLGYEDYERPGFETFAVKPTSLYEHLSWQLGLETTTPVVDLAAQEIVGNLNSEGYLEMELDEIQASLQERIIREGLNLSVGSADVEEALRVVQRLDPPGIGARDLRECLMLQLQHWELSNTPEYRILRDHAELLEQGNLEAIAELEDCSIEDVRVVLARIRHLNPKPGLQYESDATIYIQPDVYIYKMGQDYVISLNEDGLPKLHLSSFYRRILKSGQMMKEEKKFLREKFRNAVELIRNLDHRKRTIYRVCEIIVQEQRDFLDKGIAHLKPMLLKDVADRLDLHTSTVSRAVTNKWVHCPQGIIELRNFFTLGFKRDGGEDISVYILKKTISDLIEKEEKRRPLSDSDITQKLNNEGIEIKRRTVAKYREEMEIPNSRERRVKT